MATPDYSHKINMEKLRLDLFNKIDNTKYIDTDILNELVLEVLPDPNGDIDNIIIVTLRIYGVTYVLNKREQYMCAENDIFFSLWENKNDCDLGLIQRMLYTNRQKIEYLHIVYNKNCEKIADMERNITHTVDWLYTQVWYMCIIIIIYICFDVFIY